MSATLTMAPAVRLHVSLNVNDLRKSLEFYRVLFGCEPAKARPDYAKFETDDPALVLSLEPHGHGGGGALNHMGFRLQDAAALVAMQERLSRAGLNAQREEGVECCYARQTKFWTRDPDGTLWEVYTLDGDIEHRGAGQAPEQIPVAETVSPAVWEHRMGQPIPAAIPMDDGAADEVNLGGTFNVPVGEDDARRLVREAYRVLRPAGRVSVHVLTSDRDGGVGNPELPGPAAVVTFAPRQSWPVTLLKEAGFRDVEMVKFNADPCFQVGGVDYRELRLAGSKPNGTGGDYRALYKGPFAEVRDDSGVTFPRGEWVAITADVAERMRDGGDERFAVVGG